MKKIKLYIFKLTCKYIVLNIIFISILVLFINLLEISRLIDQESSNFNLFILLSFLKIPSILIETLPFVIIISISFLFRYLINNNELISMRNAGLSIIDIYKPISIAILFFALVSLIFINPIAAKFERQFDSVTSKDFTNIYSIKIINEGLWIKNNLNEGEINFLNISKINMNTMEVEKVKILNINKNKNKYIIANKGSIKGKILHLKEVIIFDVENNSYQEIDNFSLSLNFDKLNIIDSISNYKFIPFYKYKNHIDNLKKFNLYSSEITLYYISEITKPFFLVIIGFVVMGFSGKYKRNENFFKILFISILIGFLAYMLKEFVIAFSTSLDLSYMFSYFIIFSVPFIIGLYQIIKIEKD